MIDLAWLRQKPQDLAKHIAARGMKIDLQPMVELDKDIQALQRELETARAERNQGSQAMAKASEAQRAAQRETMKQVSDRVSQLEQQYSEKHAAFNELLLTIPNTFVEDVKLDSNPEHNQVLRESGKKQKFTFTPRDYLGIIEGLDGVDMERGAKIAGSRFTYLKGVIADLEFALVQFALTQLRRKGFTTVIPPVMVRDEMIRGLGYLEAGGTLERYHLDKDGLYLVGTSEQSIVPMHADETLQAEQLPKRYVGFSACFRREAGAYGKDTKGMLRVHQFDKLEMVSFTLPEQGREEHELFVATTEELLQQLGLHYRVLQLVSGDISFPLAKTYDIECWMPGQKVYRETHSISTATDFQARRLNIRYKQGKDRGFVHTLNGTSMAFNRLIIAIIEQYQTPDGFMIPEVLRPLMDGRSEVKVA